MALPIRRQGNDQGKGLPAALPQLDTNEDPEDGLAENWVWLLNKSERAFNKIHDRIVANATAQANAMELEEEQDHKEGKDLDRFTCFVPRAVLEGIVDGKIKAQDNFDIIVDRCSGALVFCDASGFTAVTEAFNREPNGAERLGNVINDFFTSLIQIINFWGGDIIKFAGDAVTIVWGVDDIDGSDGEDGTSGYHIDPARACQLACQCCLDLHRNLNGFPAGIEGRTFSLHIGVGYGLITILQVGGTLDRWDFVVAGPPVTQISIAEPLAESGDTVLSPEVFATAGHRLITEPVAGNHHKLVSIAGEPTAAPPPLERINLKKSSIQLLRRFIPPPIYQRLHAGFTAFTNELRQLSVIFVSVKGLDVDSDVGSIKANALMQHCQKSAYLLEGSVNKFSVDDKGVVVLLMFGLPPVYHMDDPIRAVLCALRVGDGLKTLGLGCGIGIATGRVWIGTVGCDIRKEYTALGDTVNLAARLMGKAQPNEVLCDKTTQILCSHAIEFQSLPAVKMKGKTDPVPMFRPPGRLKRYDEQRSIDPAVSYWPAWRQTAILRKLIYPTVKFRPFVEGFDAPLPLAPSSAVAMDDDSDVADQSVGTKDIKAGLDLPRGSEPHKQNQPDLERPTISKGKLKEVGNGESSSSESSVGSASSQMATSEEPPKSSSTSSSAETLHGPTFPWEVKEPWLPTLRAAIDLGGVMVIKGREVQGSLELVEYLKELGEASGRHVFVCSNTPESSYLPVANVALLAFRKLCTDIVYRWRNSPIRRQKGYTAVDEKNSVYSLTKELTHPLFHWRLTAMKTVIKGLVLPKEMPRNQPLEQWNHEVTVPDTPRNRLSWLNGHPPRQAVSQPQSARQSHMPMPEDLNKIEESYGLHQAVVVPAICSLINGFTMNEKTIIVVKMDSDSWRALALLAHMAVLRRRRRIELDCQILRRWRKRHSWNCAWCKGVSLKSNGEVSKAKWTSRCRPPVSTYFPPFLLVVVCSPDTDSIPDMSRIGSWARECGLYMNLGKLSRAETRLFLSYYFKTSKKRIPSAVVDYVHRVSAGYLNYVALTARQLLHHDAVETRASTEDQVETEEEGVEEDSNSSDVSSSEDEVCDYDTVQERRVARDTSLHEQERRIWIKRRRLFPTTSGILVTFKFEGNDIAQLKGCIVNRDITFIGNIVSGMGAWVHRDAARSDRFSLYSCPGPLEYAEKESTMSLKTQLTDRIFCPPFPYGSEKLARFIEPNDPRKKLVVVKDLRLVPYIAQLRAATMMLIEALKPEEQLVAKCASVFPVAFCFYELCAVFPKAITLTRLEIIVETLLRRELLEICEAPTDADLVDMDLANILKPFGRHSREEPNSTLPTDDEGSVFTGGEGGGTGGRGGPATGGTSRIAGAANRAQGDTTERTFDDNSQLVNEAQLAEEELLRHASMYVRLPNAQSSCVLSSADEMLYSSVDAHFQHAAESLRQDPAYGPLRFDDQIIRPKDRDILTFSRHDVQGTKSKIQFTTSSTGVTNVPTRLKTNAVDSGKEPVYDRAATARVIVNEGIHAADPPSEQSSEPQISERSMFWKDHFDKESFDEDPEIQELISDAVSNNAVEGSVGDKETETEAYVGDREQDDRVSQLIGRYPTMTSAEQDSSSIPTVQNPATNRVLTRLQYLSGASRRSADRGALAAESMRRTDSTRHQNSDLLADVQSIQSHFDDGELSSVALSGPLGVNGHRYRQQLPASTARLRSAMYEFSEAAGIGGSTITDPATFVNKTVEGLQGKTLYGIKADGVPVFYRFTSTAYQHVLADLLTSDERNLIAHLARMVVTMRKHYGLPFLVLQVQMRRARRQTEN